MQCNSCYTFPLSSLPLSNSVLRNGFNNSVTDFPIPVTSLWREWDRNTSLVDGGRIELLGTLLLLFLYKNEQAECMVCVVVMCSSLHY